MRGGAASKTCTRRAPEALARSRNAFRPGLIGSRLVHVSTLRKRMQAPRSVDPLGSAVVAAVEGLRPIVGEALVR